MNDFKRGIQEELSRISIYFVLVRYQLGIRDGTAKKDLFVWSESVYSKLLPWVKVKNLSSHMEIISKICNSLAGNNALD